MCGIFGVVNKTLSKADSSNLFEELALISESRGKEAAGAAFYSGNKLNVVSGPIPSSELIKRSEFKKYSSDFSLSEGSNNCILGHSRLVTNGSEFFSNNNQPILKGGALCLVHNGIIINHKDIRTSYGVPSDLELDSEALALILQTEIEKGKPITEALSVLQEKIKGSASIACLFPLYDRLLLFSNTGSLYYFINDKTFLFASEKLFLRKLIDKSRGLLGQNFEIKKLEANSSLLVDTKKGEILSQATEPLKPDEKKVAQERIELEGESSFRVLSQESFLISGETCKELIPRKGIEEIASLRRCSKCLLPESMPTIEFDRDGICNFCHDYRKSKPLMGAEPLVDRIKQNVQPNADAEALVFLSGGRDSCYALHCLSELGIKTVAYTYDWGMITDIARRNCSIICGELGVEHILVSADIRKKRNHLKKNVEAWLKRPRLGTIPLFMAGDKHYFYYGNKVQKELGFKTNIYSMNLLEKTDFKNKFCGVDSNTSLKTHFGLTYLNKFKMAGYFGKEFLLNPSYINSSLLDTFSGYLSYYFTEQNYLFLYEYLNWEENLVNNTLIDKYGWETDPTTKTTWRIGDGLASFYNYLYFKLAGFTENDTFRSNQIREGLISREEALKLVQIENQPRPQSIQWFCNTIGLDYVDVIEQVSQIKPYYTQFLIDADKSG